MSKVFAYEVYEEFFELVCGGVPMSRAARLLGVSDDAATRWWRRSGLMSPVIQFGVVGQANTQGGYWKLEVHNGWPTCHFTDSSGVIRAIGLRNHPDPQAKIDDSEWHTLRCERTTSGIRITLDYGGASPIMRFFKKLNGNVNNTKRLSLGGKVDCDRVTVTCDYFAGAVDWLTIEKG